MMGLRSAIPTAALAAAVAFSGPAPAQRESLSDRLDRLEQQLASQSGEEMSRTLADLVYQINDLQAEIRQLRGQVEEQAFEIENLRQSQQDQYLDLDARISALGAGAAGAASSVAGTPRDLPPAAGPQPGPSAATSATTRVPDTRPSAPSSAQAYPEVREAVDAQLETRPLAGPRSGGSVAMADPVQEKAAYDAAFDSLKNGRYADASREFAAFVETYPTSEFADNAQYWLGESYYVTRNYRVALDAFQRLLSLYPNSAKVPDARLKIGLSYYSLQNWEAAERELTTVVEAYPGTTVSRLAENRLRTMRIEGYIE